MDNKQMREFLKEDLPFLKKNYREKLLIVHEDIISALDKTIDDVRKLREWPKWILKPSTPYVGDNALKQARKTLKETSWAEQRRNHVR